MPVTSPASDPILSNVDFAEGITPRARELVAEHQDRIHAQTSRLFTILMLVQWVAGIGAALWISPRLYEPAGRTSTGHRRQRDEPAPPLRLANSLGDAANASGKRSCCPETSESIAQPVPLVLTDVHMPEMDGWCFTARQFGNDSCNLS